MSLDANDQFPRVTIDFVIFEVIFQHHFIINRKWGETKRKRTCQ